MSEKYERYVKCEAQEAVAKEAAAGGGKSLGKRLNCGFLGE